MRPPHSRRGQSRGFTLVELLVTFVVMAILLTIAAPSFVTFQRNSQLTSASNSLLAAISAARAEAMKRQLNVYIRPGVPGAPVNDWSQGWFIYADGDWDGAYTAGSSDVLISTQAALPAGITVAAPDVGNTVGTDGISPYVLISGAGFIIDTGGALVGSQGLKLTNVPTGTDTRLLIIDGSGRSRVCTPTVGTTAGDPGCSVGTL